MSLRISRSQGFTLTETIVALALFAFVIVGLGVALDQVLTSALFARKESLARQQLESHLAEIQARLTIAAGTQTLPPSEIQTGIREEIQPVKETSAQGAALPGLWKIRLETFSEEGDYTNNLGQILEVVIYKPVSSP